MKRRMLLSELSETPRATGVEVPPLGAVGIKVWNICGAVGAKVHSLWGCRSRGVASEVVEVRA